MSAPLPIKFEFDETKAVQTIGVLVRRCEGIFDYYLAIKALYDLDRTAILNWGQPVVGGDYRMLPWGPANQSVMDATREQRAGFFSECFERLGNEIHMRKDPGTSELSRAETKLIEEVCDRWRDLGFNAAHARALSFPECSGLSAVAWIPVERILGTSGRSEEEIEMIARETAEIKLLRHPVAD